jgi:hypothetical protein
MIGLRYPIYRPHSSLDCGHFRGEDESAIVPKGGDFSRRSVMYLGMTSVDTTLAVSPSSDVKNGDDRSLHEVLRG